LPLARCAPVPYTTLFRSQHCEPASPPVPLIKQQLYCGIYLNELLVRILYRHDKQPHLLAAYADAVQAISQRTESMDVVLRRFELLLLAELGYAVQFTHDADARPIQSSGRYVWQGEQGWHLATQGWLGEHLLAIASEQ